MKNAKILQTISTILEERKKQIGGLSRYQIGGLSQDQIGWLSQDQIGWLSQDQIGGLSNQALETIKERLENATTD